MGHVLIHYDRERRVYVDEEAAGMTNKTIRVSNGLHDFDLGSPDNVSPAAYTKVVKTSHSMQNPLELTFVRNEA